jgi:hypothetical protein
VNKNECAIQLLEELSEELTEIAGSLPHDQGLRQQVTDMADRIDDLLVSSDADDEYEVEDYDDLGGEGDDEDFEDDIVDEEAA